MSLRPFWQTLLVQIKGASVFFHYTRSEYLAFRKEKEFPSFKNCLLPMTTVHCSDQLYYSTCSYLIGLHYYSSFSQQRLYLLCCSPPWDQLFLNPAKPISDPLVPSYSMILFQSAIITIYPIYSHKVKSRKGKYISFISLS